MALKYSLTYNDVDGTENYIRFFDDSFVGTAETDLIGRVSLSVPDIDDPFESLRGTGLRIDLLATPTRTFEDLFSEEERVVQVIYSRGGDILFQGWLNPEGWFESLNEDVWTVSFDAVDALGYLEGLSYVTSTGLNFVGKQSGIDIISNCLQRTGLQQDIYVDVGVRYVGLSSSVDAMNNCYFNAERFYQDEGEPMSCQEVLKTTLNVFNACIVQRQGAWYIYRPNQLFDSSTANFYPYNYLGSSIAPITAVDLSESIGAKEDSFTKFHVNRNQQLSNVKTLGGFAVNYKYGLSKSLLGNNKYLYYDGAAPPGGYADWNVNSSLNLTYPAIGDYGVTMNVVAFGPASIQQMTSSATVSIALEQAIEFKSQIRHVVYPFSTTNFFNVEITLAATSTYYLTAAGKWQTTASMPSFGFTGLVTDNISLLSEPAPEAGNVTVKIYTPEGTTATGTMQIFSMELLNATEDLKGKDGEIHTAQRNPSPSSKIDDPFEVFVGDNVLDTYVGAIYKTDTTTNTDEWTRDSVVETKPLLQVMVEDRLRLTPQVVREFRGDVYGYMDYLSVVSIDNVSGVFLVTGYSFDSERNITSLKLREIQGGELVDIDYDMRIDYGNVVKPKIKG